jgi:hypothetical protein
MLKEFVASIESRGAAAAMLREVADCGEFGGFPKSVTCEQLGWALERICLNSNEVDPLTEIVRGYRARERARNEALRGF